MSAGGYAQSASAQGYADAQGYAAMQQAVAYQQASWGSHALPVNAPSAQPMPPAAYSSYVPTERYY